MGTKKQEELLESFLCGLEPEQAAVYRELARYLEGMGYSPKKQRSAIVFTCPWHGKQLAKLGFDKKGAPFFALRFSACRGYSRRFEEIVKAAVGKEKHREPACMGADPENFCKGPAEQRVYTYVFPGGERRCLCGAKALAIPGLGREDVPEVERLMEEEHRFLMQYEAQPQAAAGRDEI